MARRLVGLLVLLLAVVTVPALAASPPAPDTIAVLADATRPALALDPSTGDFHVVFVSESVLVHASNSGGVWHNEPIANPVGWIQNASQYGGFDVQVAPNGHVFALYIRNVNGTGQVECAEQVAGVWSSHTLDVIPLPRTPLALAVSPVTGEPTAAWTRAGTPAEIKLARRSGGTWTTTLLDTVTVPTGSLTVAVGVDLADRPRVAWGRPRGDSDTRKVLTCAIAASPSGPFTTTAVDSQLTDHVGLAVDPTNGEPRLAYLAASPQAIRYAARSAGNQWEITPVSNVAGVQLPPSIALDPNGAPFISAVFSTPIEPAGVREGATPSASSCFFVATKDICLYSRGGGSGTAPFQALRCIGPPHQSDVVSGPRALASRQAGVVEVAWRSPAITCAPYAVSATSHTPSTDVLPGAGARVAMRLAPNPARVGGPLTVQFVLPQAADVTLELRDVAGRRVAESSLGELAAGPHELDWAPAAPRAGVYWLTVQANGARLGSRSAVLVR